MEILNTGKTAAAPQRAPLINPLSVTIGFTVTCWVPVIATLISLMH